MNDWKIEPCISNETTKWHWNFFDIVHIADNFINKKEENEHRFYNNNNNKDNKLENINDGTKDGNDKERFHNKYNFGTKEKESNNNDNDPCEKCETVWLQF